MKKEKYHLEYIFERASHRSIWQSLSTEVGLKDWFADEVKVNGNEYNFYWNGTGCETAILIESEPENHLIYRWVDDIKADNGCFFEFNIYTMELTGEKVLEITDFATNSDRIEAIEFWDMLIGKLRKAIGTY